jgi:hypothetical protein
MTRASSDPLPVAVGPTEVFVLRRFRRSVADAFPGRLRSLVVFSSLPRADREVASEWDVAAFLEGFDCGREGRRLSQIAAYFHQEGFPIAPVGLPDDRYGVSPELLAKNDRQGTRIPSVRRPGELLREEPRLAGFVALAGERPFAREVSVFGSRVRGDHRPDSDGDLLVILPNELPEDADEPVRLWRLGREAGLVADVLAVRATEAREARAVQSTLMYEVGLEGERIDLICSLSSKGTGDNGNA